MREETFKVGDLVKFVDRYGEPWKGWGCATPMEKELYGRVFRVSRVLDSEDDYHCARDKGEYQRVYIERCDETEDLSEDYDLTQWKYTNHMFELFTSEPVQMSFGFDDLWKGEQANG